MENSARTPRQHLQLPLLSNRYLSDFSEPVYYINSRSSNTHSGFERAEKRNTFHHSSPYVRTLHVPEVWPSNTIDPFRDKHFTGTFPENNARSAEQQSVEEHTRCQRSVSGRLNISRLALFEQSRENQHDKKYIWLASMRKSTLSNELNYRWRCSVKLPLFISTFFSFDSRMKVNTE